MKWDGFRPVVYSLSELALSLPLTQTRRDGDQQLEDDTSIEKLLESLEGRDFQVEDETVAIRITSETGSLRLKGPTFNCRLAGAILELFKNGIKPFASRWFWYETDDSDTDPQTSYNLSHSRTTPGADSILRFSIRATTPSIQTGTWPGLHTGTGGSIGRP